jgi:hypothetical protein
MKKQNNIETMTSGFISIEVMNKFQMEGYKFVRKVDNTKIIETADEWKQLYNQSTVEVENNSTGMTIHILFNNTYSQRIRLTSEGHEYYKTVQYVTNTNQHQPKESVQQQAVVAQNQIVPVLFQKRRLLKGIVVGYQQNDTNTIVTTTTSKEKGTTISFSECSKTAPCLFGVYVYTQGNFCSNRFTTLCWTCKRRCVGPIRYSYYIKRTTYLCGNGPNGGDTCNDWWEKPFY